MRRIVVYGVTGSGKSTLAQQIAARLGLPYHSMDDLTWEPGWVPVPDDVQRSRVAAVCAGDEWVIDSAYGIWRDIPFARADLIVGLDLPRGLTFRRLLRRTLVRLARRTEICNGNRESVRNTFFARDSILWWHAKSFAAKRQRMRAWHADPTGPPIVLLRSPAEVRTWLAAL